MNRTASEMTLAHRFKGHHQHILEELKFLSFCLVGRSSQVYDKDDLGLANIPAILLFVTIVISHIGKKNRGLFQKLLFISRNLQPSLHTGEKCV